MNRKQRRQMTREKLDIGTSLTGDQGEALNRLVSDFLLVNCGSAQPFVMLVTNGEEINVVANCDMEMIGQMFEIVGVVTPYDKRPKLDGPMAGNA